MQRNNRHIDRWRMYLARYDAQLQNAVLGILCGVATALVIVAFRLAIDGTQAAALPAGIADNFEGLSPLDRALLPLIGGLVIGLVFQFLAGEGTQVGVVHVIERLAYHQARLPLANMIWQFIGATLALFSGQSVGREGPGIHLGAAASSLMGTRLGLPNHTVRTMVACGCAAAIAASFDTPLAAVIFSMEVVVMEYTIAGFMPVILAAVASAALTRWLYGSTVAFTVPDVALPTLAEYHYVALTGLLIGLLAAGFNHLLRHFSHSYSNLALWQRTTLAGAIVALCGQAAPEVMGMGYDSVTGMLSGEFTLGLLVMIAALKICATTACVGLGLPGGLIGPLVVIGAAAGCLVGTVGDTLGLQSVSPAAFYALLGMAAMMAATLQAPLAGLTALVELIADPGVILPGMLAVVVATLTANQVFPCRGSFLMLLKERGLDYRDDPVARTLRKVGIARAMNTSFVTSGPEVSWEQAVELITRKPQWLIVAPENQAASLCPATDLAVHLKEHKEPEGRPPMLDLTKVPAHWRRVETIDLLATLQEAYEMLGSGGADALLVYRHPGEILGVVTPQDIEVHYLIRH